MPHDAVEDGKLKHGGETGEHAYPHRCPYQLGGASREMCVSITTNLHRNLGGCCGTALFNMQPCNADERRCIECLKEGRGAKANKVADQASHTCVEHYGYKPAAQPIRVVQRSSRTRVFVDPALYVPKPRPIFAVEAPSAPKPKPEPETPRAEQSAKSSVVAAEPTPVEKPKLAEAAYVPAECRPVRSQVSGKKVLKSAILAAPRKLQPPEIVPALKEVADRIDTLSARERNVLGFAFKRWVGEPAQVSFSYHTVNVYLGIISKKLKLPQSSKTFKRKRHLIRAWELWCTRQEALPKAAE